MVRLLETSRSNCCGETLFSVKYLPERPPNAVLCFHHGLGEHIGRYDGLFRKFAHSGIAVFSQDSLGHGKSTGSRAYFETLDHMVSDFDTMCTETRGEIEREYKDSIPMFIGGHSLGGLISALVCLRVQQGWQGLLLCSPLIDVEWTPLLRVQAFLGNILAATIPKSRIVPKVETKNLNKDPEKVREYEKDQLVYSGPLPARSGNEMVRGCKQLAKATAEFTIPIYAHHGDADKITSYIATKRFVDHVKSEDKTFISIPDGYHEVMFEDKGDDIVDGMIRWVLERSSGDSKM